MPHRSVLTAVVLLLLLPPSEAGATVVLPLSLTDLAERSDMVVHVRVGEVTVVDTEQAPFRVTRLEVLEALRGQVQAGDSLDLWQRGDGTIFVVGDPWLETGQEGLAFVVREGDRVYLTALAQSWWRIERTEQGQLARRDLSGLHVLSPAIPVAVPPNEIPWADLRLRVLAACVEVGR